MPTRQTTALPLPFAPTLDSHSHPHPPCTFDHFRRPISPFSPTSLSYNTQPLSHHIPLQNPSQPTSSTHCSSSHPPSRHTSLDATSPPSASPTNYTHRQSSSSSVSFSSSHIPFHSHPQSHSISHVTGKGYEQTLGPTFSDEEDGDDSMFIAERMAALGLDPIIVFGESQQARKYQFQIDSITQAQAEAQAQARVGHTQNKSSYLHHKGTPSDLSLDTRSAPNEYHLYRRHQTQSSSHYHNQHRHHHHQQVHPRSSSHVKNNQHKRQHQHQNNYLNTYHDRQYLHQHEHQYDHSQSHNLKNLQTKPDLSPLLTQFELERNLYQQAIEQRQLEQLQAQQIIARQYAQLQIQQQALAHLSAGLMPLNKTTGPGLGNHPSVQNHIMAENPMETRSNIDQDILRKTHAAEIRARFENETVPGPPVRSNPGPAGMNTTMSIGFPQSHVLSPALSASIPYEEEKFSSFPAITSTQTRQFPFRSRGADMKSSPNRNLSPNLTPTTVLSTASPLVTLLSRRRADDGSRSASTSSSVSSTSSPTPTTPSPPAIEPRDPFKPILGLGYGRPSTLPSVHAARSLTSPQISITMAEEVGDEAVMEGFTVPGKMQEEKEREKPSGAQKEDELALGVTGGGGDGVLMLSKAVYILRQPIGPPSSGAEMGNKNFASRLRRQAGLNLGMLGRRVESTPTGL